ncbi:MULTISPECIES: PspC domain-containing protein [Dehalobacter]|jgi:phage shock protein PspC (stress-responsive transcriptional regulator)|uniref:PspC domain-containing protein n=2 Tax=Dehalobacter restrictus TaxID=55583 RepID=A0A857DFV9_9FIRM|nr:MULTISPECIES: PspC domain-containing protein [Dehalobacter]AHF09156.1 phage-shock protein [Dehalobacter restrictus DSM 9455]MCG1024390.1 PspC domain-containing protein [Dehalobacter sp.]MDJ0306895.1 PspC domain-containing protein [Dehalobacter sp.]QGZ99692.1 PspC domain-containing protein [Dehalobacter restrictus]
MGKQIYRSQNKVIAGVCSGIAEYFEIDPTIVRIIWLLAFFAGIGILAYLVCWVVIPQKPFGSFGSSQNYADSADIPNNDHNQAINKDKSLKVFGIALIIVGAVFLSDRLFDWFDIDILLPIGLIAVGVYVLFARRDHQ